MSRRIHKMVIGLVLLTSMLAVHAAATPYFRPADPANIQKIAGFAVDPVNPGKTSFVSEVALFTHDPKDGCLLPSVVCEDWTPFAIGPTYNAGRFAVVFGPVANLAPAAKAGLLAALRAARPDQYPGLESVLSPSKDGLTISFGPQVMVNPFDHGIMLPVNKWGASGRIFAGEVLRFGGK